MMNQKKGGRRGRPPKYIIDDKGREIVGISYHERIYQFYITQSKPRIYIGPDKNKAIDRFNKWVQIHGLPEEIREVVQRKDEIYQKALELLSYDDNIRDEIHRIASDLVDQRFLQHVFLSSISEELIRKAIRRDLVNENNLNDICHGLSSEILNKFQEYSRYKLTKKGMQQITLISELVSGIALKCLTNDNRIVPKKDRTLNSEIDEIILKKIKTEAQIHDQTKEPDSLIWDRAYDLIMEDAVKASKILGIKELAYLDLFNINDEHWIPNPSRLPMPWWFVWRLYKCYVDEETNDTYRGFIWRCVGAQLGLETDIETVSEEKIIEALGFDRSFARKLLSQASGYFLKSEYIPYEHYTYPQSFNYRLSILKHISGKVSDLGFHQCLNLYKLLMNL